MSTNCSCETDLHPQFSDNNPAHDKKMCHMNIFVGFCQVQAIMMFLSSGRLWKHRPQLCRPSFILGGFGKQIYMLCSARTMKHMIRRWVTQIFLCVSVITSYPDVFKKWKLMETSSIAPQTFIHPWRIWKIDLHALFCKNN